MQPSWVWPDRADRWRRPALVAASVALHAAVLGYLALRAFDATRWPIPVIDDPFPDAIPVQLEPRPLLPGEQARVRRAPPPSRVRAAMQGLPGTSAAPRDLPFRRLKDDEDQPSAPVPHVAGPAAASAAAGPAATDGPSWTVRPEAMGDRVARSLRTSPIGCATPHLLGPADLNECERRFAERAAAAAPIEGSGDAGRDAAFAREGARALARYEARRQPLAGGTGVVGPQDGPGSNFGMGVAGAHLDPSLRPDSTRNIHTRRDTEQARDRGD